MGTLTRNTGRQLEPNRFALISRPPTSWPTTTPPASTAEYELIARARAGPGVGALDQAEYLRDHHRGTRPLGEAQRDQLTGRAGQAAAERGQREQDEPAQEHAPVADDVAEPGAGHQQDRVGDDVAGHHQLQARAGGAQAGVDRGSGDVDDGRVEHGHELADEDDGQDETGTHPAFAAGQQAGAGVSGQDVGHALSLVSVLSRYQDTTYPGTDTTWQADERAGRMEAASGLTREGAGMD